MDAQLAFQNFLDPQRKETIAARKTMDRIGRELIDQSKAAAMGSGEKGENWRARDLLSLLVKANISKDVPEHQRMSDADVLARTLPSSSPSRIVNLMSVSRGADVYHGWT